MKHTFSLRPIEMNGVTTTITITDDDAAASPQWAAALAGLSAHHRDKSAATFALFGHEMRAYVIGYVQDES